jgi:hypothetical protein
MSDLPVRQFADKAYQAEIISPWQGRLKRKIREVAAMINLLKDLVGSVGGFLGEEAFEEEENA